MDKLKDLLMPRLVPLVEKEVMTKSEKSGNWIIAKNVPKGDVNYPAAQAPHLLKLVVILRKNQRRMMQVVKQMKCLPKLLN